MFNLADPLEEYIELAGIAHKLNLYFDTVLLFFDLMQEDMDETQKIHLAFQLFVEVEKKEYAMEVKVKTVETIVNTLISQEKEEGKANVVPERYYDLTQDAPYIYASFMQDYGIDLLMQQGKLRWEKFQALLFGLRENTCFKEIIGIRQAELPSEKYAKAERARLIKLKAQYQLNTTQAEQEQRLDALFDKLGGC